MTYLLYGNSGIVISLAPGFTSIHSVEIFSPTAKEIFRALADVNLFTLKFHMVHRISEHYQGFGDIVCLDSSTSEYFNYVIKSGLKVTSFRKVRTFEEAVQAKNSSRNMYQ